MSQAVLDSQQLQQRIKLGAIPQPAHGKATSAMHLETSARAARGLLAGAQVLDGLPQPPFFSHRLPFSPQGRASESHFSGTFLTKTGIFTSSTAIHCQSALTNGESVPTLLGQEESVDRSIGLSPPRNQPDHTFIAVVRLCYLQQ